MIDGLTIALTYFENPLMLVEQQRTIEGYPHDVRRRIRLIVADDGSREVPAWCAAHGAYDYTLEIYRIAENIPWNQLGARNLAMHHARDGWCLMTDIDHVLPFDGAVALFNAELTPGSFYIPGRRRRDGAAYHPHPNSYIIERSLFWKIGGCNEDYRGWYGTDGIFRKRAVLFGGRIAMPRVELVVYNLAGEDIGGIPGAATRLPRKNSVYHIRGHPEMMGRTAYREPPQNPLRFHWERVL